MEGQQEEQNGAITLSALSPAGREFICQSEIPIYPWLISLPM